MCILFFNVSLCNNTTKHWVAVQVLFGRTVVLSVVLPFVYLHYVTDQIKCIIHELALKNVKQQ